MIRSFTIGQDQQDDVNALVVATADLDGASANPDDPRAPIWPTSIDQLSSGWPGAKWVRFVANYENELSEGYATLKDLALAHEFPADLEINFVPNSAAKPSV